MLADNNNNQSTSVLFACSELTPWVKTGGLADVCGSLPRALQRAGDDIRLILPGYKSVLDQIEPPVFVAQLDLPLHPVALCSATLYGMEVLLVTHPTFSNRDGNPYMSDDDRAWPDNAWRFALFSQAVIAVGQNRAGLNWRPDVVHCHDWQTGLVPALMSLEPERPATVFTIHNLAYQGNILHKLYADMGLPIELFNENGLEFWGQASFIKGGIAFADRVNTVSPTYSQEIKTPRFGNGMDGMLRYRGERVSGILNGIDHSIWDPAIDGHIPHNYDVDSLNLKSRNKVELQKHLSLPQDADKPVFGVISRLAVQKGIDILVNAVRQTEHLDYQLVVLGSGDTELQNQLMRLTHDYPDRVAVRIGFDEALSRLIEAGSDVFLMPSRYEPCGLNQLYSLRYGTLPLTTRVGGLADTVLDADEHGDKANGFLIEQPGAPQLANGMARALERYTDKPAWRKLQQTGMSESYSWDESAHRYRQLYQAAIGDAALEYEARRVRA